MVRQPSTGWPSSAAMPAKTFSHSPRWAASVRQEHHPDAVFAGGGQGHPRLARDQLEELMRRLDQNARPVAGVGLATARAAVIQVQQHLQRLLNNGMGLPALDVLLKQPDKHKPTSMIGLCQEGKSSPDALRRSAGVSSF